ncbi:hypothetical protein BD626DRAFT_510992 [Schizophyllum amplum]|uniref:Uncharacterized protein n=1 Tax=Schizophyllum amplum TaxID=97359 RepID=A0A550C1I4_9AGAR|nr:hypothetical protein BD626DRAFT_510992 [Auriculariopsis ampla]
MSSHPLAQPGRCGIWLYLLCSQTSVATSDDTTLPAGDAFSNAYTITTPGIFLNIDCSNVLMYVIPRPAVWMALPATTLCRRTNPARLPLPLSPSSLRPRGCVDLSCRYPRCRLVRR